MLSLTSGDVRMELLKPSSVYKSCKHDSLSNQPTTAPNSGNPIKSTEAALVCVLRSASYTCIPFLLAPQFCDSSKNRKQ